MNLRQRPGRQHENRQHCRGDNEAATAADVRRSVVLLPRLNAGLIYFRSERSMPQSPSSFALGGTLLMALLSAHHPTVTHASAAQDFHGQSNA